jgi:hypothetical protein
MGTLVAAVWKLSPELAADATFSTSWESARKKQKGAVQSEPLVLMHDDRQVYTAETRRGLQQ